MKLRPIIYELFGERDSVYDIVLDFKESFKRSQDPHTHYRYHFITKDQIKYEIYLNIWENRTAKLDFRANNLETRETFNISLTNKKDAIKVFNTIKKIIDIHKSQIDDLIILSTPERIRFYKILLEYFSITYDESNMMGYPTLTAHLNPKKEETPSTN